MVDFFVCLSNRVYPHSSGPPLMWNQGADSHVCLNERGSIVMFPNGVVQINSLFS